MKKLTNQAEKQNAQSLFAYHSKENEYTISMDSCRIREYCRLRMAGRAPTGRRDPKM